MSKCPKTLLAQQNDANQLEMTDNIQMCAECRIKLNELAQRLNGTPSTDSGGRPMNALNGALRQNVAPTRGVTCTHLMFVFNSGIFKNKNSGQTVKPVA